MIEVPEVKNSMPIAVVVLFSYERLPTNNNANNGRIEQVVSVKLKKQDALVG